MNWIEESLARQADHNARMELHDRREAEARVYMIERADPPQLTNLERAFIAELDRVHRKPLRPADCTRPILGLARAAIVDPAAVRLCAGQLVFLVELHAEDGAPDVARWYRRIGLPALQAWPVDLLPREGARFDALVEIFSYYALPADIKASIGHALTGAPAERPPMPEEKR